LRIDENDDGTVLAVLGPIRLGEVPLWLELAQRARARALPVEIDLRAAEHMHTCAWQVLYALQRELRAASLACGIVGLSPAARAGLSLVGLASEFAVSEAA
jgi:anti-anti-sigma regulatory factor